MDDLDYYEAVAGYVLKSGDTLTGMLTMNFEGSQFKLAQDASPFYIGSWYNTTSGALYTLVGELVMKYEIHNATVDGSGNFTRVENNEACELYVWTESGKIKYYYDLNTTGAVNFALKYSLDISTSITSTGAYTNKQQTDVANGAGAVGFEWKTNNSLTNATSKVARFLNGSTEIFFMGNGRGSFGSNSDANVTAGFAFGNNLTVSNTGAIAMGDTNISSGSYSFSCGYGNTASNNGSTAMGLYNVVAGLYAVGLGFTNAVDAAFAGAYGASNTISSSASYSQIIGYGCISNDIGQFIVGASNYAYAGSTDTVLIGNNLVASGASTLIIGDNTTAASTSSNAVLLGSNNYASSISNVCLGSNLKNGGNNSALLGTGPSSGAYQTRANSVGIFANSAYPIFFTERAKYTSIENKVFGFYDQSSVSTDLITNGNFTGSATGWTLGTGWAYGTNNVTKNADGTGTLTQAITGTVGKIYLGQYTISNWTVGSVTPSLPTATFTFNASSANGTYNFVWICRSASDTLTFTPTNTSRFTIDTISLKEVTSGDVHAAGILYALKQVSIGAATATNWLDIAGGTTTKAPIHIDSGSLKTTAVSGDIEYDGKNFYATRTSTRRKIALSNDSITSTTTVANTTTETTVFSMSIGANGFAVGDVLRVNMAGFYSTANGVDTFTLRWKIGSTTILSVTSDAANVTNAPFHSELFNTVRTIGATGTLIGHASVIANNVDKDTTNTATTTFDTTATMTFTITVQWSAANASNTFSSTIGFSEIL